MSDFLEITLKPHELDLLLHLYKYKLLNEFRNDRFREAQEADKKFQDYYKELVARAK